MLETKISPEDIYFRYQETLIVWCDPESNEDLSLSFQDAVGCNEFWDLIKLVQKKLNSPDSSFG